MSALWYNRGKYSVFGGTISLLSDTIKVMLVSPSYVFNNDHNFVSEINANEIGAANYVPGFGGAGRLALTNKTITEDDTNDWAIFDADDMYWPLIGAGANIGGAALIKEVTSDSDSILISFVDLTDTVTTSSSLLVAWSPLGILKLV